MRVNAKVLIKAGTNLAEMNGLICCLHPDEMGFYIIAGVVDIREIVVSTQMLNYFEKLLRAEALKKYSGLNRCYFLMLV